MAHKIIRDADNKWNLAIDWDDWVTDQARLSPNGPALTITITAVSWALPVGIVQEPETSPTPRGNYTDFIGSGGTNNTNYDLVATITYTAAELSVTDLTQDRTISIRLQDQ